MERKGGLFQNAVLREDSRLLITKTAFLLLIPPKDFIGMQGEAEQRKAEVGQAIPEKGASRERLVGFRDRNGSYADVKMSFKSLSQVCIGSGVNRTIRNV